MPKKIKPEFIVSVSYNGFDRIKDKQIIKFAKSCKGVEGGSGYGFGGRDISLYFKSEKAAENFRKSIKVQYSWVKAGRNSDIHVSTGDDFYTLKEYRNSVNAS